MQVQRRLSPTFIVAGMSEIQPITGIKGLEFGAIGPVPFCGMMLADISADVPLVVGARPERERV